ncbi:hypothetical protein MKW92_048680 [Papaver armeniacum]|nr:hypothetical protein MKW92_048680 [Papaver armeniacum]
MEVAGAAPVKVSISARQPSRLSPRLSIEFCRSSSNASFMSSTNSFPLKACSLRASIKDNPKPVTEEMKKIKIEEDSSELDRLLEEKVSVFNQFMSNYGLVRSLVLVQIKWLIKLSQIPEVTIVPSFSEKSLSFLEGLIDEFDREDYRSVTRYARCCDTEVEAVRSFLGVKCPDLVHPEVDRALRFSAHACTHEDLIKSAYAFSLNEAINKVMLPIMDDLIRALCKMAKDNVDVPMLCRTDDQATSTTMGKEIAIFAARLSNERHRLSKVAILGDFSGYAGNHNANVVAYPELDWQQVAKEFVEESLGLTLNPHVRVEPHDYMVDLVYAIKRFSAILAEFFKDVQAYTSLGIFNQISEVDEFKSLTTPHEVNILDQITEFRECRSFILNEEMERITKDGECGWSSSTLFEYAEKLPATLIIKKMGEGLMSHLLSYRVALLGIGKLQVNKTSLRKDLDDWWQMLLVPAETVMERYGIDVWRYGDDEKVTEGSFKEFISEIVEIPEDAKANLLKLTPQNFIGKAAHITNYVDEIVNDLGNTVNVM